MPDFASPCCYTRTIIVYGIKKKKEKPNQCVSESGWVSERVSERGEWEWFSLCGWLIVWVSVWSGEWRTDRQTDRQIERGDREERRKLNLMSGKGRERRQRPLVVEGERKEREKGKVESDRLWKLTVFSVWACDRGGYKVFFLCLTQIYTVETSFCVYLKKKV